MAADQDGVSPQAPSPARGVGEHPLKRRCSCHGGERGGLNCFRTVSGGLSFGKRERSHTMKYSNMLTIPAAVALLALGGPRAQAATFTVTNLDDTGIGSLRHAILSADIVSGADAVVFQAGLTGTIHLSADEGELPIIGDLLIEGPGPTALTVSGSNVTSVFSITAGST